jgi:phenylacetate-coenzyme A ligase PaaK-like adenylate-forming protein
MDPALQQAIFQVNDHRTFRETALKVFYYQAEHNLVYRDYLKGLGSDPDAVHQLEEIPFLPVEFFKTHRVISGELEPGLVFESSGTTGSSPSRHYIAEEAIYRESFTRGFRLFYGAPEKICILALLPSYLQRSSSSLVYMMDHLISQSGHPDSGFYMDNLEDLSARLKERQADGYSTLLMGVSFALLDLAEKFPMNLGAHFTIMETGGMKGHRKEVVRDELHQMLSRAFGVKRIHSEYGMTELLSQGYSSGNGIFRTPPWMRILVRDPNDPLTILSSGQTGGLNIIDLANLYSCSFIACGDLGKAYEDGSFEVLGRFDHSDIRGCNLLVS